MLTDADVEIIDRRYGKNYVRLLCVRREGPVHYMKELEVNTKLTLNDARDFVKADNSKIVATDTQKNTVYILAKKNGVKVIEEFAMQLSQHFLNQYSHVTDAYIYIEDKPWQRIKQGGREHVHAFVHAESGTRFCEVHQARYGQPKVRSGVKDLKVLKTTQSAFVDFHRDEYRSLPDMADRIFCTIVEADWTYDTDMLKGVNFDQAWEAVKSIILQEFAGPPDTGVFSPSVQNTLYETCKLSLGRIPQMVQMKITLPNVHAYEYDFKKFPALNIDKNNEVFQPTDKPSGNITATVRRKCTKSKL